MSLTTDSCQDTFIHWPTAVTELEENHLLIVDYTEHEMRGDERDITYIKSPLDGEWYRTDPYHQPPIFKVSQVDPNMRFGFAVDDMGCDIYSENPDDPDQIPMPSSSGDSLEKLKYWIRLLGKQYQLKLHI